MVNEKPFDEFVVPSVSDEEIFEAEIISLDEFVRRMHTVIDKFGAYWRMGQANGTAEVKWPNQMQPVEWCDQFQALFELEDVLAEANQPDENTA